MTLTRLTKDLHIIQALADEPNKTDGLSADALKAKFDEAALAIQTFLNSTVLPEIEGAHNALQTQVDRELSKQAISTMQLQYDAYAGFVTTEAKDLYFTIPLAGVAEASSVSLTGQVTARGVNGYLNGTTNTDSFIDLSGGDGYTVTAQITACGIRVRVNFNEAISNAVNNTPATVTPYGSLTAVFEYD